jgi:CheY-like chemotaxis protein
MGCTFFWHPRDGGEIPEGRTIFHRRTRCRPNGFHVMNFPDPTLPPILIVDDCDDDAFLLRHRLRDARIVNPIVSFHTPVDALNHLRFGTHSEPAPSLLFVDVRMPGDSGFELIARIRDEPQWEQLRIVVITSSSDSADMERALALRADGYLIKFPPSEVLANFVAEGPWFALPRRVTGLQNALSA